MKFIILILLPFFANAQLVYKGRIIHNRNKANVPFATIGLMKENVGINADELGQFDLPSKGIPGDTLIISCVGFETFKMPSNIFTQGMTLGIEEKATSMKPVILKNKFKVSKELNGYANCGIGDFYTSGGYITQVAQKYHSSVQNSLLSKIGICKEGGNSLFRVRVYDVDTLTGKPSTDLADTIIEVNSSKKNVQVDLEKLRIFIPNNDFFIAIEWIYIPYNERSGKSKTNGKEIIIKSYTPYVFFNRNGGSDLEVESWGLNYQGIWTEFFGRKTRLLISAVVKY